MIWALLSTIVLGGTALGVFIYYLRSGQFENMEDVKYQLFRHDQEKSGRGGD